MESHFAENSRGLRLSVYIICMLFSLNLCLEKCPTYDVKRSSFGCKLHASYDKLKIFCIGEIPPERLSRSELNNFIYVFMISVDLPIENRQISLATLLNDPEKFDTDSHFYTCDPNFRSTLSGDILPKELQCPFPSYNCLPIARHVLLDKTVTELVISNQKQLDVSKDISPSLTGILELTIQNITKITLNEKIIQDGSILYSLILTNNNIKDEDLKPGIFSNVESLQTLDLSYNVIKTITNNVFYNLQTLTNLLLNHNFINFINQSALFDVPNVKKIDLSHNNLSSLPEHIFDGISKLSTLNLSQNRITTLPEELLWKLRGLKYIYLSKCELANIPRYAFKNCHNLVHLDLSNNNIITLLDETLENLVRLKILDLSHNMISLLSDNMISTNVELEKLLLRDNRIVTLPETFFSNTKSLHILDFSENKLETVDDSYFRDILDLYYLNATMNNIKYVEIGLHGVANVRKFDFSKNQISSFKISWSNAVLLDTINFDYNSITEFRLPSCIPNMKTDVIFFLRHNEISTVYLNDDNEQDDFHCYFSGMAKNKVYLSDNPFNCNCSIYDFYKYMTVTKKNVHHIFPDKDKMVCMEPSSLKGVNVINLPENFMCPISNCPQNCTCGVRKRDERIVVNCTFSGLNSFPQIVPQNTTVLYAQHNEIRILNGLITPTWEHLVELYLDYNSIESFELSQLPKSLLKFSISHNRLADLPNAFKNFVSERSNFILTLGDNNWHCNCSSKTLKNWFIKEKNKITDLDDATCDVKESGSLRVVPLYRIPDGYLCPAIVSSISTITICIISVGLILITILTIFLVYYAKKDTIKAYLYIHHNWLHRSCFKNDDQEDIRIYDAFVAYSSHDKDIVMDIIGELESKTPSFKLCIHERDWMPGNFVSQNIAYSVQNSRRTILILSESFVASVWFGIEVRAALFQTLQDGGHNHRLVIVLAGDFPAMDQLDEDLKQILLRKTYLKWGERWFWEKLKYAMPHERIPKRAPRNRQIGANFKIINIIENDMFLALNELD